MDAKEQHGPTRPYYSLALLVFAGAVIAALTAVIAGIGNRFEWWHFRTAFQILRAGFLGGFFALFAAIPIAYLAWRRKSIKALVFSLVALLLSLHLSATAFIWNDLTQTVPPIHDITTDTENPPLFSALLEARKDAPNPSFYGGPEVAEQQEKAYPDIESLHLPIPPHKAFEKALTVVRDLGWDLVATSPAEGRIEASDTTFWFGFTDDMVIRITPDGKGSRIDIRSVSRVGKSDVGTNAKRIRRFLKWMQE